MNNLAHSRFHLYADDMVINLSASTLDQAVNQLQSYFDAVQHTLNDLKLILNAEKSKLMMCTKRVCTFKLMLNYSGFGD